MSKEYNEELKPGQEQGPETTNSVTVAKDLLCTSGNSPPERNCTKCGQLKVLNCFYSKGGRRDSHCKACVSKVKRARYRKQIAKTKVTATECFYSSVVRGQLSDTATDGFSAVIAESIQGLIDEGKI